MPRIMGAFLAGMIAITATWGAEDKKDPPARRPHNVNLTYYVTDAKEKADVENITAALQKVKSATAIDVNLEGRSVRVTFDSHAVSYHQIAQAIAEAGAATGKKYDPRLKIIVPAYNEADNAKRVDAILNAKRLGQRTRIEPVDKAKGEFLVHFLSLQIDPSVAGPQGFNGGHLNHPISDAPPRGLGLKFIYFTEPQAPK
jgi:copper chaperone CopZ